MNKEFLYDMLCTASVSGDEFRLQRKVMNYMKDVTNVDTDTIGNVYSSINDVLVKFHYSIPFSYLNLVLSSFKPKSSKQDSSPCRIF